MTPGSQPARDLGTPGGYQRPEAPVDRERAVSFREWVRQAEFVGTHELAHHAIVLESRDVDPPSLDCPPGRGRPAYPPRSVPRSVNRRTTVSPPNDQIIDLDAHVVRERLMVDADADAFAAGPLPNGFM